MEKIVERTIDIAIVGGGISGVYSAWKLKRAYPEKHIVLLEASDHIGGRLLSIPAPGIASMVAELGGMRILPSTQPLVERLLSVLNEQLPERDRIETYPFPVDQDQNIAYLRGRWLRLRDFKLNPDSVPYQLSFIEKGELAGSIIVNAIEQIVPGITDPKLAESERRARCEEATFAGKPLYRQGFWNVLSRVISGEAYLLGVDAGGYSSTLANWNAAAAIPWYLSDFGVNPEYRGFRRGFQQVPLAMAELFRGAGGEIRLETPVRGFDFGTKGVLLQLDSSDIAAHALILAMPRRSLDLLAPESPPLREIQDLITSVTPRPLFKLFTTYSNPWWRAAGYTDQKGHFIPVEAGRTVTDLPVRQTYYWPKDTGDPSDVGPSMLMASYDDGSNIGYWDGLRPARGVAWDNRQEVPSLEDPFLGAQNAPRDSAWLRYKAPRSMVDEVNRQLAIIHGLHYVPEVEEAAFRDWGDDPFGGGWNCWNIGVRISEVKEKIVRPYQHHQLFICGEAYSDAQGWVEGALQTADKVLANFGLQPI